MIDRRIGERIKQRREELGLTQEQFAEQLGLTTNYISTIERGASFPRYAKLVAIINGLETSADSICCDVIEHTTEYRTTWLSEKIAGLPPEEQQRILEIIELLIAQEKEIALNTKAANDDLRPLLFFSAYLSPYVILWISIIHHAANPYIRGRVQC